jgi:negative regulator of flagellin synthesis FlgM
MKINSTPNQEAMKAYTNNSVANVQQYREPAQGEKPAPAAADRVNISSTVKLFQDIQKAVLDSPDIRTDKVKDVETKIAQGTYAPDYNAVADKLLSPDIGSRI